MRRFIQTVLFTILRLLLRLRYKVRVQGLDKLRKLDGPVLILPNHVGHIDPPLVLSFIRPRAAVRPMVNSADYRNLIFHPIMRAIGAFEVPDLASASLEARQQALEMLDAVVERINAGDSFLLYPSGRIQRGDREILGAARSASDILERCPDVNVVLVRTRGLWGTMFSFAQTGKLPDIPKCALRGIGWMLANLIFFAPRRKVTMTIEVADRSELPIGDRAALNAHLEAWYNADDPPGPVFVPYHHLLGPRDFDFPGLAAGEEVDVDRISPETKDTVREILEHHLGRPLSEDEQSPETTLDGIGLDSLGRMDVALEIEERFGFRGDRVMTSLGGLWMLAEGLAAGATEEAEPAPAAWTEASPSDNSSDVLAETIAEAFVRRALRNPGDIAMADRLSGALTYRRLLVGARLLSKRIARFDGDAVGIMLPASVAADLVFFATHLAGKLPVILNWTTGPANMAHAVEKLGIKHIVTSSKFIDRLRIDEVDGAGFEFLEDLRGGIGKFEALTTLMRTYVAPGSFPRALPKTPDVDDPAVVLFTSGSESLPKAVPLSHRNLITNVRASIKALRPGRNDSLLGFLPPFHSFGIMGTVILPVLTGIRVVHHPDPTDSAGLVRTTAAYKPTYMITTPTFLGYMLAIAGPDDLSSLRVVCTGAEKCPDATFERCREMAPDATVLEGYGITECSPVVSANRPEHVKPGSVGKLFDGVTACVVDPDTNAPLPRGQRGMLLVRGPSIFNGYLDYDGPDPFVEVDGHRWYKTGDLVELDEDDFLYFRGRLKRFLKAGGEMISLPALEEPFARLHPPTEDGPQVAVEGIETPTGRCIVLFTTFEMTAREANQILTESGLRGVMRIDQTRTIDAIPVLGTGKTDYKVLRKMVMEMNP